MLKKHCEGTDTLQEPRKSQLHRFIRPRSIHNMCVQNVFLNRGLSKAIKSCKDQDFVMNILNVKLGQLCQHSV